MIQQQKLSILTINFGAGGAERVISLLLKHFVNDYEVTLVVFYEYIDYEIPKGVKLKVLLPNKKNTENFLRKSVDTLRIIYRYNQFIKSNHIEISMAFLALPNIINGLMAMRHRKLKTIISERCYPSIMYKYNNFTMPIIKVLFPLLYNKNDALFSNSTHINNDLKINFKVRLPMSVIYNPIEIDETIIIDPEMIAFSKPFKLINVGTMQPPKNQKLIIDAISLLNKENHHLTYLGDGHLIESLKTKAFDTNVRVDFKGKVNNVKSHLIQNDCFILSSDTEGFPNVLLEALSVGLPSIATNCMSGPLELLNDNEEIEIEKGTFFKAKYGLLVHTDDAIGLSKAITYFHENYTERQRYSKLAFERSRDYNLPKIYQQVKSLIDNC